MCLTTVTVSVRIPITDRGRVALIIRGTSATDSQRAER